MRIEMVSPWKLQMWMFLQRKAISFELGRPTRLEEESELTHRSNTKQTADSGARQCLGRSRWSLTIEGGGNERDASVRDSTRETKVLDPLTFEVPDRLPFSVPMNDCSIRRTCNRSTKDRNAVSSFRRKLEAEAVLSSCSPVKKLLSPSFLPQSTPSTITPAHTASL